MNLDAQTLALVSGIIVTLTGTFFLLETVLWRNDSVGRLWSIAFVSGILATMCYAVWGFSPAVWWIVGTGNAAFTMSIAAMWSGCRLYNGKPSRLWIALTGSILVGIVATIPGPAGDGWAGATELFVAVAVFALLAGIETLSGALRRGRQVLALTIVFFSVGTFYAVRSVVYVVDGRYGDTFATYFSSITANLITIVFVILAAMSLSSLMAGREGSLAPGRATEQSTPAESPGTASVGPRGAAIRGVLASATFDELAADWLARAGRDRETLVLIFVDIANLTHMNTVFGRDFGNQAVTAIGRMICESAPTTSIVGHLNGGKFAILTPAPNIGDDSVIAESLHTALAENPIDTSNGLRANATCGVVSTAVAGNGFAGLFAAAAEALAAAQSIGPGAISVAGAVLPERKL